MKRLILATAVILLATAAVAHDRPVSTGSVQAVNDAAAPAVAVVDAFHAALGSGDPEAVLSMLTEDVMVLEEGGAERSRDEYAGHHLRADMTFAAATTTEVTRRASWIEGNVAWVLTEGRTTGAFNSRPVDRLTAETMILHRDGDVWRIRHIHWSSRAPR